MIYRSSLWMDYNIDWEEKTICSLVPSKQLLTLAEMRLANLVLTSPIYDNRKYIGY